LLFILIGIFQTKIALSQCTVTATPINFGSYDVFSDIPLDTTGIISVSCSTSVVKADITLGPSSNSGTFNPRKMKQSGGNNLLNYNIYIDVTRTTILGNGTGGTAGIGFKRPPGKPAPWSQSNNIYGRIPPGQDVSAGSYSDTLSVTVNW
jgi:spore coat protein U-like protein